MRAINKFQLGWVGIVGLLALAFLPGAFAAEEKPANCPSFFARIFPARPKLDAAKYLELRRKLVADYFPERGEIEISPGIKTEGTIISQKAEEAFRRDFDQLVEQTSLVWHFKADKFREYLKSMHRRAEPYPELNPHELESVYKNQNIDLEELVNSLAIKYHLHTRPTALGEMLDKMRMDDVLRFAKKRVLVFGEKTKGVIKTGLIAGPIATIFVSGLSAPIKPITEGFEQVSNIVFSGIAKVIQQFTNDHVAELKKHLSEMKATSEEIDKYDFNGMDRDEAKKIMDQLEHRYNVAFLRFKGFMPGYQGYGREIVRDWLIMQPLQLANHASTFNTEYALHKSLLERMEKEISSRGPDAKATTEEKEQMEQFREAMEGAENRLAVTLASWKLYTFAFAEVSRSPQNKDANATLMNTLTRYQKFMNMDKYRKEFSAKIKEAFENLDPSFQDLKKLEKRREDEKPAATEQ